MLDKNSSFYKDFEEFKRNDLIREEVSELVKPLLNKMFPGGRKSVQIAHKDLDGSQIGGTLPEGKSSRFRWITYDLLFRFICCKL